MKTIQTLFILAILSVFITTNASAQSDYEKAKEEIKEAVSHAAWVRYFSTTSNGAGIDLEQFKQDFQKIVGHKSKTSNN